MSNQDIIDRLIALGGDMSPDERFLRTHQAPHIAALASMLLTHRIGPVIVGRPQATDSYKFHHVEAPLDMVYQARNLPHYSVFQLTDPDQGLPEWQKRRNQSARDKQKLVQRMKKGKAK